MKKLNEVLDGVMSDILSESEGTGTISDFFQKNKAAGLFPFGSQPGGDANPEAQTMGMSQGIPAQASEPGYMDQLATFWGNLSDGQKMAILGGAGGTALAAGAGALYLRRKQREANRAMGR